MVPGDEVPVMLNEKFPTVRATRFFFSSRSRHTISDRDWSSDVCSSDLLLRDAADHPVVPSGGAVDAAGGEQQEIGRASWRERGEISVVAVSLKKKRKKKCRKRVKITKVAISLKKKKEKLKK